MTGSITPVAVPALTSTRTPPGRPATEDERILVPGTPRDEPRRPEAARGRIPVGTVEPAPAAPAGDSDVVRRVDAERENSIDYRILKAHFKFDREEQPAGRVAGNGSGVPSGSAEEADSTVPAETPRTIDPQPAAASRPETSEGAQSPPPRPVSAETSADNEAPRRADPLVLDLDGDGFHTTGIAAGIRFDLDADGHSDRMSNLTGADAFLALDRNGNGRIDDGSELFGDQHGHANGFEALAEFDDNGDGFIDADDGVFASLRLLRLNPDGGQALQSLESAGVTALELSYRNTRQAINAYDTVAQLGRAATTDGDAVTTGDLLLGYRPG